MLMLHDFKAVNLYWQITETKSKNWDITQRYFRKQNPAKNFEYLVIILIFLKFLGTSPCVIYGNKIQSNFPKEL